MTSETAAIDTQALEWTIRVQHPEFDEWDVLTAWLEADPRHAERFDRLTLLDDEAAAAVRELPSVPVSATASAPAAEPAPEAALAPPLAGAPAPIGRARRRPELRWALLAAGLALIIVPPAIWLGRARLSARPPSTTIAIATQAGERQEIRLADGTEIVVAGATRLSVDPTARRAQLDEGQATFSVAHDPAHPFAVQLGDATITDVGTVFDLRRRDGRSVVDVAQGEVRVDGVGAPVEVTAGRRLRFAGKSASEPEAIAPSAATAWQRGRFTYADATIAEVAADIEHATGARISMSPGVADQRFAGTITVSNDPGETLRKVAPVLGLAASRVGNGWVLGPAHDAHRR